MNYNYIRFSGIVAVLKSPVQNCTGGIAVIFTPALAGGTGRAPALSGCAIIKRQLAEPRALAHLYQS